MIACLWSDDRRELPGYSGKAKWSIGVVSALVLNARRRVPGCRFVLLVDEVWARAYDAIVTSPGGGAARIPDALVSFSGADCGGWSRICEVFRPDLAPRAGERNLFVGLDTVFVDDARWLFEWDHAPVGLPLDPYHAPERCDAVVSYDAEGAALVWAAYEESRDRDGMRADLYAGKPSEMALLRRLSREHGWPPLEPGFHRLRSYKVHGSQRVQGTTVVYFHGTPKPQDLPEGNWVRGELEGRTAR